jgi:RNA polymerase sigma factor (sigma-70 family)
MTHARLTDERLAILAGAGDERALELLYERHSGALMSFCRHLLGTREEAEDVLQQTFVRALGALRSGTEPEHLRAWLFTIARNRALSVLGARREVSSDALEMVVDVEGLAEAVERRSELRALLADIACLPEPQRAALLLAELEDFPQRRIAEVLGTSESRVKALVFRARQALMADRAARAVPCGEIRAELAVASGPDLRRASLRRHLRQCARCRAFQRGVATQRAALAAVLPVSVPVGLLARVIAAGGAGAAGGAAAGAGGAAAGTGGGAAGVGGLATGGAGCEGDPPVTEHNMCATIASQKKGDAAFTISSPDFANCGDFPASMTCDGKEFGTGASPTLSWSGIPAGTMSLALVFKDIAILADGDPTKDRFGYHWVMWNIPVTATGLPAAATGGYHSAQITGALQWSGRNQYAYFPPCPNPFPKSDARFTCGLVTDSYSYTLYALPTAKLDNLPAPDLDATTGMPTGNYVVNMAHYIESLPAIAVTEYRGRSKAWSTAFNPPNAVQYPCTASMVDAGATSACLQ